MTVVASGAAAILVWILVTHPGARQLRQRLGQRGTPIRHVVGDSMLSWLVVGAAGIVTFLGWGLGIAAAVTSIGMVAVTGVAVVRATLRNKRENRRAAEVARACDLIGSLVAIGHIPAAALAIAAEDCRVLEPVVSALRVGTDAPTALRTAGEAAGGKGLLRLAQAWEVGERTGAPLGQALSAVAEAVRRDAEISQVVTAELAGPRASGQVLALLPVVGLAVGSALGSKPFHFFLTGVLGPLCLVFGVGLACGGVIWTDSMVLRATPGKANRIRARRRQGGTR